MRKKTLAAKILRNILIFCILLFTLAFSVFYAFTHKSIKDSARDNAILIASNTVNRIETILKPAEMIPLNIARMLESSYIPEDSLLPFLKSIIVNNHDVYGVKIAYEPDFFADKGKYFAPCVFKRNDTVSTAILGNENYEYFYMDWYQIPRMTSEPYWSEPFYDEGGGNILMSSYSVPFYTFRNKERSLSGIVSVDISLDWLTDMMSQVRIFSTGYAFTLSRNGVIVTHPNKKYVMNNTIFSLARENNQPGMRKVGKEMIAGHSNFLSAGFKSKWHPGKLWINYMSLPSSHWSIGVIYPDSELYASLHKVNIILIVIIVIGLLLLLIFSIRIIRRLLRPLSRFADSARLIAEGNFNVSLPEITTDDEMKELHNSFSYLQKELSEYIVNLQETTTAKEKIESELRIAREIQMEMIPHIFPPYPDLQQVDVFAILRSAKEVGGDLYDFFVIEGNRFCFAIGDVSGKGIPASLYMAVTRTLVRSISDKEHSPCAIVSSLNRSLSSGNDTSMFVTFFFGILDLETGLLTYCNAGHNPPVILRADGQVHMFEKTKFVPAGLFEDSCYEEYTEKLRNGDKIFLYTDGVSEAENSDNVLFGEENMLSVLHRNLNATPRELIQNVEQAVSKHVEGHFQSDDITMMTIVFNG